MALPKLHLRDLIKCTETFVFKEFSFLTKSLILIIYIQKYFCSDLKSEKVLLRSGYKRFGFCKLKKWKKSCLLHFFKNYTAQ